jgi:hypothetical protein
MNRELSGSRRGFLKGTAAFGGSALLLFGMGKPTVNESKQPSPEAQPSRQGYRLTEQIKRYYETARL